MIGFHNFDEEKEEEEWYLKTKRELGIFAIVLLVPTLLIVFIDCIINL